MKGHYDVVIVGAGPAGVFALKELVERAEGLSVLVVEKGRDIDQRRCPLSEGAPRCMACSPCNLLSGWGGAGAFSDGKLSLSPEVGGNLRDFIPEKTLRELIDYVDSQYVSFGAPEKVFGGPGEEFESLKRKAALNDLILVNNPLRHIGTERCRQVLRRLREALDSKAEFVFDRRVKRLLQEGGRIKGVVLDDGTQVSADFVIVAPGREGSRWFEREARRLGLSLLKNPVDLGLRVEVPAEVMAPLTEVTYEPKLIYYSKSFDDKVRTFCVNPYGEVVKEHLKGVWTVNGHSYAGRKTDNTNFAILVSTFFTEPFNEPLSYGRYIARLANFLGMGVIVQRLGDLRQGRRSTHERLKKGLVRPTLKDATPGDLSFALPYRYMQDILEMLEAMDGLVTGVNSRHTLLYGIEVKFYSRQVRLTQELETEIEGLFAIGDGAGVSRGLVQASVSGVLAARAVLERLRG